PHRRADEVVGVADVRDPVTHRFVDRVLERAAAACDRTHRGAEKPHAKDVERLALDVVLAHEHFARDAEERADGRSRNAVLAGTGFCDDPRLAHALCEQALAETVVDLVGAGMAEVFALEPDLRAAKLP